jgi:RNA polymerase-binding protein DksA
MTCHVARRPGEFESRLRRDRYETRRTLERTDEELLGLARSHRREFVDDAARESTRCVLARLEEREYRALTEITAAEERLATGAYGKCEACGRPIGLPRLRALPVARLCIRCEEEVGR